MKVPSPIQGRTRIATQQASYLQPASNPGAGAQAIARGMGQLGNAVTQIEATFKQRDQQTEKFNTLRGFSEFQTAAAERLTELKRDYRADGKGFVDAANGAYGQLETEWLKNVPADLQDEFKYRSQESRRGVLGDALEFQYTAGDAWFKQGVSDELSKAKTILDQSPQLLEEQQRKVAETIDATDLPEIEKENLKRQATIGLASVTYKAEVRKDVSTRTSLGVGDPKTVVDKIIGVESGGRANAKNPLSSASGLGQFIDSTWISTVRKHRPDMAGMSDGELLKLKTDPAFGREMTEAHTQDNIDGLAAAGITPTDGNVYLAHFLGLGGARKALTASPEASVASVLGEGVVNANPFLREKTIGNLRSWATKKMGGAKLETDPRFEAIPYEDRVALYEDAEREAQAEQVQVAKETKVLMDQQRNDLYLGLLDGRMGQMDIDNARANGLLADYDEVSKALGILKDRDGERNLAMAGYTKIAENGVFDPTSTDDKKMLNAVVKAGNGLTKLQGGDANYVSDEVVPLVNRVGDIPTDIAGTLMGMLRGGDNARAMFALDSLAQLRDTNEIAFNQRISEDVARQVDLWDARKDTMPKEELLPLLRGGTTQNERQARAVLRKEAQDILSKSENGVAKGRALLDEAVGDFGGFWSTPSMGAPLARQALEKEFQTLFVDEYSRTGDETLAAQNVGKALQRSWGVFDGTLMKFPPDKVGYRAIGGSYDWIEESARRDLQLKETESYSLFSDEQTRQEFQAFQKDPNASAPSYRAFIKDENGVYRERTDERGQPIRLNFEPSTETLELESRAYDWQERLFTLRETIFNYQSMQAAGYGADIPQEDTDAYNAATKELEELENEAGGAAAAGAAIGGSVGNRAGSNKDMIRNFMLGSSGKSFKENMAIERKKPASYEDR